MGNKCLCCGKELETGLWHKSCIQRFFGSDELPELTLDAKELKAIAIAQLGDHKGVAGVQEKLSLHLDLSHKKRPRLTIFGFPSGYILKPQSSTYKRLPEFEHTAMLLAECCGIAVAPHGLVPLNGAELAYITKRMDRDGNKKVHMEDFCQATGNLTMNKYRCSYEECAKLILAHSHEPYLDRIRFFEALYFCFLIGNSDAHLKNFSFRMDSWGRLTLAPLYDLLPTKVILPSDSDELGMVFNGRKNRLSKRDFEQFALSVGLDLAAATKIMNHLNAQVGEMVQIIEDSLLDQNSKSAWKRLILANLKRGQSAL